jgi:hypothetical protein
MSSREKCNLQVKSKFTPLTLRTSLQKQSFPDQPQQKKQSELNWAMNSDNSKTLLQNVGHFSHNLANFPIQSRQESTINYSLQEKHSSHKNSCGCPICRKPANLKPKIQRVIKKNQHLDLISSDRLQTKISPKLAVKNNFSSSNSTYLNPQTSLHNSQLVGEKTQPTIQGGFFSKIKKGFQKIGRGLKKTFRKVGKVFKKVGNFVWNGIKWVAKQLWSKLTGIFLRVFRWINKLPTRIGRLLLHIWKGVKSFQPWSLKWWKSLGNISTWKELLSWLGTSLVYLLEIAGVGEVYETVMDFVKFNTRPLTSPEIARARTVFGNSINYALVRVDQTAVIGPAFSGRAYVSFQTINAWATVDDHTFIHELTHVWQYEKIGAIYMPKAIHAQAFGAGYEYGDVTELNNRQRNGQKLNSFNMEQQGQILGDYYMYKTGKWTIPNLQTYEYLPTYEYFVADAKR